MTRVLFMGTPRYAVPSLEVLLQYGCEVRVATRPDAPKGRQRRLQASPVAEFAAARALLMDKPGRLAEMRQAWVEWAPDLVLTAAYGKILPAWLLELPRLGAFNLHASLLPRWRGANPIRWAIWAGDDVTGVSLMRMDPGVDTGPIVANCAVSIRPGTTAGVLTDHLSGVAAQLLEEWLPRLLAEGPTPAVPQSEGTYAPKWDAGFEHIDVHGAAPEEARRVWALAPEPGAYVWWKPPGEGQSRRIKVLEATPRPEWGGSSGVAHWERDAWILGLGQGGLEIRQIKPEGRGLMTPGAFMRGLPGRIREVTLS